MDNQSVKNGVIGGVIGAIITFVLFFTSPATLASMWVPLGVFALYIILAVMSARAAKAAAGGLIDLKGAFVPAFTTFAIASVIGLVAAVVAFEVIDPDMKVFIAETIIENTVEMMSSMGAPADSIDEFLEEAKEIPESFNAVPQILGWFKGLVFYAIISLIIGAIVKSKRHELEEAQMNN